MVCRRRRERKKSQVMFAFTKEKKAKEKEKEKAAFPIPSPNVWGPSVWESMLLHAFAYPEHPTSAQKQAAFEHYRSYGEMLICKDPCAQEYRLMWTQMQVDNTWSHESRAALVRSVLHMFNTVRKRLHKPRYTMNEAMRWYKSRVRAQSAEITLHGKEEEKEKEKEKEHTSLTFRRSEVEKEPLIMMTLAFGIVPFLLFVCLLIKNKSNYRDF